MKLREMTIRDARPEDAAYILELYSYYVENTAITFEYESPSLAEFTARMDGIMRKYPYLVAEQNGQIVGYAYASTFRGRAAYGWCAEVTIYLARHVQKCGLGRRLYQVLEEKLKAMGVLNCYACIGYPEIEDEYMNRNSANFHGHLGYREIGRFHKCGYKFNRWYDMIYMEKLIGERGELQPEVKAYKLL